jgi:signal transduction histidine kinase
MTTTEMITVEQIAHDIKSPLATLETLLKTSDDLPEMTQFLLKSSIERINDIAGAILFPNDENKTETIEDCDLIQLLKEIVTEKKYILKQPISIEFVSGFKNISARVNGSHLKRIISNLINNSFESITHDGKIKLFLEIKNSSIRITISDNGKGIPKHLIPFLGNRGFSFGKESSKTSGSGLGYYHAKKHVKKWGGKLLVKSTVGVGTSITIVLPLI